MKNRIICSFLTLAVVLTNIMGVTAFAQASSVQIYVSEHGSDNGDGSIDAPFKTIERAIDSILFIKDKDYYSDAKIEVVFMGGSYDIDGELVLDDSVDNVTFRSYDDERVTWRGNHVLNKSECEPDLETLKKIPSSARASIKCIDVSEYEINDELQPYYDGVTLSYSDIFLFSKDTMMSRAKWPNEGFKKINAVYDTGANVESGDTQDRPFVIGSDYENVSNWSGDNIWVEGFGVYTWSYDKVKVAQIDKNNKKITSVPFKSFTGIYDGAKLRFLNIIEELDMPGEWYIDDNKLYYYSVDDEYPELTTRTEPLLQINNSKNITFENIDFKGTRGDGIVVNSSENVVFNGCSVSQIGKVGLTFSNTYNCRMINSAVHDCGTGGVVIGGGIKETLEAGNNYIENCVISRFSQVVPVYTPGIRIIGVGNYAKNNTIFDSWHTAVMVLGNNNKLIRNEIFDVVKGSSDAAAIYAYCDASSRGIEITENYIHHLGIGSESPSRMGVMAIYLDGWMSSRKIEKNVMYDCSVGINLNGGSDNIVNNNLFIDTPVSVYAQRPTESAMVFWSYLQNQYFDWDVWYREYPEITNYNYDNSGANVMKNVVISNNMRYNSSHSSDNLQNIPSSIISVSGDTTISKSNFVNYNDLNFALTDSFYASKPSIKKIEFDKIGADMTIYKTEEAVHTPEVDSKIVEYNMNNIVDNKGVLNSVNTRLYPLSVGVVDPGKIVAKNGRATFLENRCLYAPEGYYSITRTNIANKLNGDFTISIWVKPNAAKGNAILNLGNGSFGPLAIIQEQSGDRIRFGFQRGFTNSQGYWMSTSRYQIGKWYNIVVRYSDASTSNDPEIFVNGSKVSLGEGITPSGTAVELVKELDFSLGGINAYTTLGSHFGDVVIYDNILSESRIKELYDEAKPTYNYTLDAVLIDNSGNYINDYSAVNPEGVRIDVAGVSDAKLFSTADDEEVSFAIEETSSGVILKDINLGYGKTYKLLSGDGYIEFTTVSEDYTVDYKLNNDNSISVYLTNNTQNDASAELYAAVYEQDKLVAVNKIHEGTLEALTEKKCDDVELQGVNENTNISFIMVDGINTLRPLIRKINVR